MVAGWAEPGQPRVQDGRLKGHEDHGAAGDQDCKVVDHERSRFGTWKAEADRSCQQARLRQAGASAAQPAHGP